MKVGRNAALFVIVCECDVVGDAAKAAGFGIHVDLLLFAVSGEHGKQLGGCAPVQVDRLHAAQLFHVLCETAYGKTHGIALLAPIHGVEDEGAVGAQSCRRSGSPAGAAQRTGDDAVLDEPLLKAHRMLHRFEFRRAGKGDLDPLFRLKLF